MWVSTIPFAFALGTLRMRYPGEKWIVITRRWTLVTWLFLTIGIFLGMHWAYAVLGWGGYWGWDPVENASLMPWLAATAFIHSVIIQEKRGDAEELECVVDLDHLPALDYRHTVDARRIGEFGACLCAIEHWVLLFRGSW